METGMEGSFKGAEGGGNSIVRFWARDRKSSYPKETRSANLGELETCDGESCMRRWASEGTVFSAPPLNITNACPL
jgi:hypothetical protein